MEEMAEYIPRKLDLSLSALKATDNLTGREKHLPSTPRIILGQKSFGLLLSLLLWP